MISTEHTQSLSDFRKKAAQTIERLNRTGEAEILTVNGEARAVLLSPAVYDDLAREALLARDAAVIRRSIKQFKEGKGQDANTFFDELRSQLVAMKSQGTKGATE
jgi:PHD/YefM family antitoxin component YafN of YafNO toxin-antitoxin module